MAVRAIRAAMARDRNPLQLRTFYETLAGTLKTERSSFDNHWKEIGDFMLPRRTRFFSSDRNRGDRRNQNIIDSTARFAQRTLSSGLHAGLTSPARPWFKLTTPDPDLARHRPVQEWLTEVTKRMQIVFASTNLYNALPTAYGDLGGFGTAALSLLPDSKDLFRCYAYPLGSYAIEIDNRGLASTFAREYELSVLALVEEFGVLPNGDIDWSRISPAVKQAWDKGNYSADVPVTWIVARNPMHREGSPFIAHAKWISCYFETGGGGPQAKRQFLRESGFKSFPVFVPRWDVTAEDSYGVDCPGMIALGDIKQLQVEQREKGKAIKKQVDPPMVGEPYLRTQKTSILPGDITYAKDPQHGFRPAHEVRINLGDLREDIREVQFRIQRAFYEDLFLMLAQSDAIEADPRKTATEIMERKEEKMLALGPVLEHTNDELLNPLIDRAYELMDDAGLIPEAPTELQGVKLKVEYISIMAQAQKLAGVASQDRLIQTAMQLAPIVPDVLDKIDFDYAMENYGDMLGTDPKLLRTQEQVDAVRQQRGQMAATAQGAQNAALTARAAKDASDAKTSDGTSVLDQIVQAGAADSQAVA